MRTLQGFPALIDFAKPAGRKLLFAFVSGANPSLNSLECNNEVARGCCYRGVILTTPSQGLCSHLLPIPSAGTPWAVTPAMPVVRRCSVPTDAQTGAEAPLWHKLCSASALPVSSGAWVKLAGDALEDKCEPETAPAWGCLF